MESEKENAAASFARFRTAVGLRQISELLVAFALISWSAGRFPAATGACFVEFSEFLLNHHVVFLIGNAIIVSLFMICRRSDDGDSCGGDFYDDYVKYSEAAAAAATQHPDQEPSGDGGEPAPEESIGGDDGERQLVVRADDRRSTPQSDDVAAAIEKAKRQIQKFQRTQSEKLKREISVRQPPVYRRSETDSHRKTVSCVAADMETLSNEEFRRKVDAFIDAHWSGRRKGAERIENYPLLKMA